MATAKHSGGNNEKQNSRNGENTRAQRLALAARLLAEIIPLDRVAGYYPSLAHERSDGPYTTRTITYDLPDRCGNWAASVTIDSDYRFVAKRGREVRTVPENISMYVNYGTVAMRGIQLGSDRVELGQTLIIGSSGTAAAHTQFGRGPDAPAIYVVDDHEPVAIGDIPAAHLVHPLGIDPRDSAQNQVQAVIGAVLEAYDFGFTMADVGAGLSSGNKR